MAGVTVTWSSNDTSVATVSASGLVTGIAVGVTTIAANAGSGRGTAEITVIDSDRVALEALFEATDGPNWADANNWRTDEPLGEWSGVRVDATGRVVGLDLCINNLSGPIPPEIGNLARLTHLDLYGNSLSGPIHRN